MEVLDLKSSETKEYNSENEAEEKGIADSIYLNKNADTGLAAPLLEPSHNEEVTPSEDSNKEESKYVVIDIVQESEEEVGQLIRCCSCFSFFVPSGSRFNLFRIFGKKYEEDSQKPSLAEEPSGVTEIDVNFNNATAIKIDIGSQNSGPIVYEDYPETTEMPYSCKSENIFMQFPILERKSEDYSQVLQSSDCDYASGPSYSGSFGDDLINEFKRPVKHVDLPRPKGS